MAFSLNRAQLIGNVTRAPEVRSAGGSKVATFGVATNFSWMDTASGQRKDKVEFHNVVAWRKLAEVCELYLKKGTKVYIEGRMQTRDWQGEDGVKRYKTEIIAESMIMLDRKGDAPSGGAAAQQSEGEGEPESDSVPAASGARTQRAVKPAKEQAAAAQDEEISIDDLPF
ncbi:MAG: single-stranded DNA-binding protein [Candidatus Gracilibacteria bacterium]